MLALAAQAWLTRSLLARGVDAFQAQYLAYLIVPPILLLLLAPVLLEHRISLQRLFSPRRLTLRLALAAVALGVTMRIAWWSQLIARVSLGITVNADPQAVAGPVAAFVCPPPAALALGMLVLAVLVPLTEETVHRGVLQSALVHRGPLTAVTVTAAVFAAFHPPSSYGFVFLMGLVLGTQFWRTSSLAATTMTHASYNGLVLLDWHCLHVQWNPAAESLPKTIPGLLAVGALLASLLLVVALLHCQRAGAREAPAAAPNPGRLRRAR